MPKDPLRPDQLFPGCGRGAVPPEAVELIQDHPPPEHSALVDPVHFGIIFLANMELGFLMPPIGLNLLLASYRFKKPLLEVCRAAIPMLLVLLLGVLLITYFPPLTTFLPSLFANRP